MVTEDHITAGGFTTRYLRAGDPKSPTLVLLHDGAWGGASSVSWGACIERLAEQYHVLAPDMLGFGGTDKAVFFDRAPFAPRIVHVAAFLDAAQVEGPIHIAGTSFGGSVALRMLATELPFALGSVVSVNGSGGPWRTEQALREIGRWDGTKVDLERVVDQLIERYPGWEQQIEERYRWASETGHYRAVASVALPIPDALKETRTPDPWPAQLEGVQTPVLLVAGSRDRLLEPDWTDHFRSVLPHLTVSVLDTRHEPNVDRPDLLVPLILDFLARTRAGG